MTGGDLERVSVLMERYGIAAFEYEIGRSRLVLTREEKSDSGTGSVPPRALPSPETVVTAPCVGFFSTVHPASLAGDTLLPRHAARGEIIGYIRAGAMLRPVVAPVDCVLVHILVAPGAPVGYGDAVFAIST